MVTKLKEVPNSSDCRKSDLGLIVLPGFKDRGLKVNSFINELRGETDKNYIISIDSPRFANGEGKVVLKESIRGKDIFILADVSNYGCTYKMYGKEHTIGPDEHFMDIVRTVSAISGKAKRINLFMPMLYEARQHRRSGRESLDCAQSLRYLESLGVSNIVTFDAHDPSVQNAIPSGSFETVVPLYSILKTFIANEYKEISPDKMVVVSPDTGAMERTTRYASVLGLDLGLFYKRRDCTKVDEKGKNPIAEHLYIGPDVKGKSILIIDDMISSGGSVLDIAEQLKAKGCEKVYIIVTFALFTEGFEKFDKLYEEGVLTAIYATNASYISDELKSKPWFKESSLNKYIAKLIDSLNRENSLAELISSTEKIKKLLTENEKKLK